MLYNCPKCGKPWMEWDGRAKILLCYGRACNHVVRIKGQKEIPTEDVILEAIRKDKNETKP